MSVVSLFEPDDEQMILALEREEGNVTKAAERLGVAPAWLRRKINSTPTLEAAIAEIMEQDVDRAVAIMRSGLKEESYLVRFYAAKEFLRTETARRRGFGMPQHPQVETTSGGRAVIVLKWLDDDKAEPKQLEGPLE
jgi:hypothetical protein